MRVTDAEIKSRDKKMANMAKSAAQSQPMKKTFG